MKSQRPSRARSSIGIGIAASLSLLFPGAAHPAATIHVTAEAAASAVDQVSVTDAPPAADSGVLAITSLPMSDSRSLQADARGSSALGHGQALGQIVLDAPGSFHGARVFARGYAESFTPAGTVSATASGRAQITYHDVLTAGGAAPGTPVTLRVRLELSGSISLTGAHRHAAVTLELIDPASPPVPIAAISDDQDGQFTGSQLADMVVISGTAQPIELHFVDDMQSSAAQPIDVLCESGTDFTFAGLGRLYIDVLTQGANYTLESGGDLRSTAQTSVAAGGSPGAIALSPPRPNPARGALEAELSIPPGGARGRWTVIDATGRLVWRSSDIAWSAGLTRLAWTGNDASGRPAPAGIYFLRVESDLGTLTRRVVRVP